VRDVIMIEELDAVNEVCGMHFWRPRVKVGKSVLRDIITSSAWVKHTFHKRLGGYILRITQRFRRHFV